MNVHSHSPLTLMNAFPEYQNKSEHSEDRRRQILRAATVCFARRGFHQTTMQDISTEAQISVGLIYRYFENKNAVISGMAEEHKRQLDDVLARARQAGGLKPALEVVFTSYCEDHEAHVEASFVVDLFAEAARDPLVGRLVQEVVHQFIDALTDLIAGSVEMKQAAPGFSAREAALMLVDASHGLILRDITDGPNMTAEEMRARQIESLRRLWTLLFPSPLR